MFYDRVYSLVLLCAFDYCQAMALLTLALCQATDFVDLAVGTALLSASEEDESSSQDVDFFAPFSCMSSRFEKYDKGTSPAADATCFHMFFLTATIVHAAASLTKQFHYLDLDSIRSAAEVELFSSRRFQCFVSATSLCCC